MFTAIWALVAGRAVQAVSGPFAQLIAYAVAAFVLVGGVAWGVHAIRADARADERAKYVARQALAQLKANQQTALRVAASEEIAAKQRGEMADELARARERMAALEQELAKTPRGVAYPVAIAKRLSQ